MNTSTQPTRYASRRAVAAGAAWATPVVLMTAAAPAFAASCLRPATTTNFCSASYTHNSVLVANNVAGGTLNGSTSTGALTGVAGTGATARPAITLNAVFYGRMRPNAPNSNNTVPAEQLDFISQSGLGGTSATCGIQLYQAAQDYSAFFGWSEWTGQTLNYGHRQELTFSFSCPVYNLSFWITDIDAAAQDFIDNVAITGATFTSTKPAGSAVTGTGTLATPFVGGGTFSNTQNGGTVQVTMAGPVSSFTVHYWNTQTNIGINNDQLAFITNLTYQTVCNSAC